MMHPSTEQWLRGVLCCPGVRYERPHLSIGFDMTDRSRYQIKADRSFSRIHSAPFFVALGMAFIAYWALCLLIGDTYDTTGWLHSAAVLVHIVSLVVGFGAVLTVDWVGLLYALKKRTLEQVIVAARHGQMLIWLGLIGLLASGALLSPSLERWPTRVKMGLVLLVGINGLIAWAIEGRLSHRIRLYDLLLKPFPAEAALSKPMTKRLLVISLTATTLSQVAWWGAVILGFLVTQSRIG